MTADEHTDLAIPSAGADRTPPPPLRLLLGAFGDPGHAFPMIALGRALVERGHQVTLQTWGRWREAVEGEGMTFAASPEYHVFPTRPRPMKPYEAVVAAAREIAPLIGDIQPDAVVADILTLAPALAAEQAGCPVATLIPHVYPVGESGFPVYSIGARLPRTAAGRTMWRRLARLSEGGLAQGRGELNETRRRLGLPALTHVHGGISRSLALVGTFPQLEYPREWPRAVKVVGPLMWEPPFEDVELPPGDKPLVLVAPSTSQDPDHRLLAASLRGLADAPVRVLATWNRRPPPRRLAVPGNARLVEWVSYSRTMPHCDAVVCHGGHGTVIRALSSGCTVVACPAGGDMNENAARVDWAGVGVRLPRRYVSARPLRLAVMRAVEDASMRERAGRLAKWAACRDAGQNAATSIEELALRRATVSRRTVRP
jgi:MGT family glycosyltransferase